MRIGFLYNAELFQIPHSAPIAFELSQRHPHIQVTIIARTEAHLAFVKQLAQGYPNHSCEYRITDLPLPVRIFRNLWRDQLPPKLVNLFFNRSLFSRFDALVVAERTSLYLKKMGLGHLKLIHSCHGAGDRPRTTKGDEPRVQKFDFVLLPGRNRRDQWLGLDLIRPGHYAITGYCKFDLYNQESKRPTRLFPNDKPTVLYNPHFQTQLSSWKKMGHQILEFFARTSRYNLIFAPHARLFDRAPQSQKTQFQKYTKAKNILIDLGSDASMDMTYTRAADIYLGDVSSQVYEFLVTPRPCIFLNPHGLEWENDPHYHLFWRCGPVLRDSHMIESSLEEACQSHADYLEMQKKLFNYTFDLSEKPSGARGADAIAAYLSGL